jgi:GNAT superfamily N-acetyltransferase
MGIETVSYELQVHRSYQGLGLGRWLLRAIEKAATHLHQELVMLTVFNCSDLDAHIFAELLI